MVRIAFRALSFFEGLVHILYRVLSPRCSPFRGSVPLHQGEHGDSRECYSPLQTPTPLTLSTPLPHLCNSCRSLPVFERRPHHLSFLILNFPFASIITYARLALKKRFISSYGLIGEYPDELTWAVLLMRRVDSRYRKYFANALIKYRRVRASLQILRQRYCLRPIRGTRWVGAMVIGCDPLLLRGDTTL